MSRLAELIRSHHSELVSSWARAAAQAATARGLSRPALQNVMPRYFLSLADAGEELGHFSGQRRRDVENHLSSRLRQGFQLAEIVEEFALVGRCISALWSSSGACLPPDHSEIEALHTELHLTTLAVSEMFMQHMQEDEQTEKRYQRLLQAIARDALEPGKTALHDRLKEVLQLIMEAMGSQCIVLMLVNRDTEHLDMVASVGTGDTELETYVSSLNSGSFVGQVAANEEPVTISDVAVTNVKVNDALKRSGIRSVLGVRLPPRHRLLGILYIGSSATRQFTGRELHRIELLGEQLTLHLDNARLFAELEQHIERLQSERAIRERFVSVLAHDLRGPLSAAKVASQLLVRHPALMDERRDLAVRIERNIDRTDNMIRDLLDENRLRAGERLQLRIAECDLFAVAQEVYEELTVTFGDRFDLRTGGRTIGFWSQEELRRALWNLATNAIKYGAPDTRVTLSVEEIEHGVRASVHNWGSPISEDDQRELFKPFSRTRAAMTGGQKGWGLGLTLVQGCANAHGGRVGIHSSEDSGTTFLIELPFDSRPFQPGAGESTPDHGARSPMEH